MVKYKDHPDFGYIFRENARDVLNKQNPGDTKKTLNYLAQVLHDRAAAVAGAELDVVGEAVGVEVGARVGSVARVHLMLADARSRGRRGCVL